MERTESDVVLPAALEGDRAADQFDNVDGLKDARLEFAVGVRRMRALSRKATSPDFVVLKCRSLNGL